MRKIILKELRKLQDPINIVIHQSDSSITVDIIMDDTKVGEITLEKGDENAYTIIDAEINNDFRGKGLYQKSLIKILYQIPNIRISSIFRSTSAERSWILLLKNLPNDIGATKKRYSAEKTVLYTIFKK